MAASPNAASGGDQSSIAYRSPGGHGSTLQQVDAEAAALKLEMMRLRERRKQLDEHRRALKRQSVGGASSHQTAGGDRSTARSHSAGGGRSASAASGSMLPLYDTPHDPPGATHIEPIVDERSRREHQHHTVELEMKEAMKKSWENDPCLVSGFFLEKQGTKAGTFGRAARFSNPVGMKGHFYYLSNDAQKMQSTGARYDKKRYCVATRGKFGANVNVHWNDSRGGGAPGPGTYTPRFTATTTTLGNSRS